MTLFDSQRVACLGCGGPLVHPAHGRPRRYCDADCAAEGKRASDRKQLTPHRLAAMRLAKARWKARNTPNGSAHQAVAQSTQEPTET